MIKIGKARRQGKTTEAIRIANATGAYLVVRNRNHAKAIQDDCDRFPITFDELIEGGMKGSFVRNIVIDDVDVLKELLLQRVIAGLELEATTEGLGDE